MPELDGPVWDHWYGWRCPKMDEHSTGSLIRPCPDCYAIEHLTRPVQFVRSAPAGLGRSEKVDSVSFQSIDESQ